MRSAELAGFTRAASPVDNFLMDIAEYVDLRLANNPLLVERLGTLLKHRQMPEITRALDTIERAAVMVRIVHRNGT